MSDSNTIKIDYEAILKTVQTYVNTYKQLEDCGKNLLNTSNILQDNWTGKGCDKFLQSASIGLDTFQKTAESIQKLGSDLSGYLKKMREEDEKNANLIEKIFTGIKEIFAPSEATQAEEALDKLSAEDWEISDDDENELQNRLFTEDDVRLDREAAEKRKKARQEKYGENYENDDRPKKAYIFYQGDARAGQWDSNGKYFKNEAEDTARQLQEQGIEVEMIEVNDAKELELAWNNMNDEDYHITNAEIILHGSADHFNSDNTTYGDMYFCNTENDDAHPTAHDEALDRKGKSMIATSEYNASYKADSDVLAHNLKRKEMDNLTFSSCNTGLVEAGEHSIMKQFESETGGPADAKKVIGFDGTSCYDHDKKWLHGNPKNGGETQEKIAAASGNAGRSAKGAVVDVQQPDGTYISDEDAGEKIDNKYTN